MPFPQTLNAKPRVIFFTDFDGTITLQDTNDHITANYGCGEAKLKEITKQIADDQVSFRDGFQQEFDSWMLPLPKVLEIMKRDISLDPHFKDFVLWAKENSVPIIVVSSGMIPIVRTMLAHFLGEDLIQDIEIVANDAQLKSPINSFDKADGWTLKFHDSSSFGHDKSLAIRPYANAISQMDSDDDKPTLLYAGDGVSDLSAARETDLLFAKAGKDLVNYCEREHIPFTTFENWESILAETKDIYSGKKTVKKLAEEGLRRHRTNSFDATATATASSGSDAGVNGSAQKMAK